jgi:hypothetical protein
MNIDDSIKKMKSRGLNLMVIWVVLSLWACNKPSNKVVFEEMAGIARSLEYVTVSFADQKEEVLFLEDGANGTIIRGEKLKQGIAAKDSTSYIFPISIGAHEKKTFIIAAQNRKVETSSLKVSGENVSIEIENDFFVADFSSNKSKEENGLYPGQLAGILVKNKEVLIKRGHINMHWAPNFQKEGMDYKTIGHVNSSGAKVTQKNSYMLEMVKGGSVPDYEEIDLFGRYNFFDGLPYFVYSSTISFNKDVELTLLRNDEMTMDSLYTHLIYPDSKGKLLEMPLYNIVRFDSLTMSPLADDINWVGFINKKIGYGLVSLRLTYDNRNHEGKESPLFQPHTKISDSRGNGRYWNRRLIHEHKTMVPKGSKYHEKNAYLILDDLNDISGQINHYLHRLKSPVVVSYFSETMR